MIPLSVELLEQRDVPSAFQYHGGPLLHNPEVNNIYIAGSENEDALTQVVAGDYMKVLSPYYGVGPGGWHSSTTAPNLGPFVSDYAPPGQLSQLQTLIVWDMLTGQTPLPSANDEYVIHLAPGEHVLAPWNQWDIGVFAGYHSTMYIGTYAIPYAVVLDQGDTVKTAEVFSHEVAEAATDPVVFPTLGIGTGWQTAWPGWEIGDIYAWEGWQLDGFTVQVLSGPDFERLDHLP